MATVGINFGAATSGSGFDVAATVTSILAISQAVETPWKSQLTTLQAQDTALTSLGSSLSTLSSAVHSLTDFQGVLASKQGSSSNSNMLALTSAGPTAIAGSHTITVSSLAQTSSVYSDEMAHPSDILNGQIGIQVGIGAVHTLVLNSTDNTLATLASAINLGSYGVQASVVTDTNGTRLSIVSQTSGAAGQITLSPSLSDTTTSASVGFSPGQNGVDAQLTVDGLATTSASNNVSAAIPGVSFQLLAASATPIQVQITNDNVGITTSVQTLVTAYNSVVTSLKTQEGNDASGNAEPLFGSPTLALIQQQLSSSLLAGGPSGSITNLSQLGLSLQQNGTLQLDPTALNSALSNNYGDVQGFFQNAGSFGQSLSTALDTLGNSSPTGALTLALAQNSTQEAGFHSNITTEDALLATQKTALTAELNTANQILQSIPAQLNAINEIYSAISGYGKISG
jgi:flagellar hook-associated protein 2